MFDLEALRAAIALHGRVARVVIAAHEGSRVGQVDIDRRAHEVTHFILVESEVRQSGIDAQEWAERLCFHIRPSFQWRTLVR